jgi:hypothetical protein
MSKQPEVRAPEGARKLPEWVSFPAAITGFTIFAFATSSFYVIALERSLHGPLTIYFSLTDYLRITPVWAIPTLGVGVLTVLILELLAAIKGGSRLVEFFREWLKPHKPIGARFFIQPCAACLPLAQVAATCWLRCHPRGREGAGRRRVPLGCLKSAFGGGAKMPFVLLIFQKHRVGLFSRVSNLEVLKLQF